jgi:hypothetical protein
MTKQNTDKDGDDGEHRQRNPRGFWSAVAELIRSRAAYYRAKAQEAENPKSTREGPAAWLTAVGTCLAAVLAGVAAYVFWCQLGAMQEDTIEAPLNGGENLACTKAVNVSNIAPIFPKSGKDNWWHTAVPGKLVAPAVLNGKTALLIQGCVTYRTMREPHLLKFCYVLIQDKMASTPEHSAWCQDGQYAD